MKPNIIDSFCDGGGGTLDTVIVFVSVGGRKMRELWLSSRDQRPPTKRANAVSVVVGEAVILSISAWIIVFSDCC